MLNGQGSPYCQFFFILWLCCLFACKHATANSCLQEWVPTTDGSYIYRIDCSHLGLEQVPDDIPDIANEVRLVGNRLKAVSNHTFAKILSLRTLDLSGNDIVTVEEGSFANNKDLKILNLKKNKIHCDWRIWWLQKFSKRIDTLEAFCFTPLSLRGKDVTLLTKQELSVDCMSVKMLTGNVSDGQYFINISGRDTSLMELSIYCRDMNTGHPLEYLTLPSGPINNYVLVSDKDGCSRLSSGASDAKLSKASYFTRVRLNLQSMTVMAGDATFASNDVLIYGHPVLCQSSSCLSGKSMIDLRGTPFMIRDQQREIYEQCSENCSACSSAVTTKEIPLEVIDKDKQPHLACTLPLGLESGRIPDSSILSSSDAGEGFEAFRARLNAVGHSGWCASEDAADLYLQVNFDKMMTVSGISTQGHKSYANWVKSFQVKFSTDGRTWFDYKERGRAKIFMGGSDPSTVATHWFTPRLRAVFVRVAPLTWQDSKGLEKTLCMRVEVYGCELDVSSYVVYDEKQNVCLAADIPRLLDQPAPSVSLKFDSTCVGVKYMFLYQDDRLEHAQTGLCVTINNQSGLVLDSACENGSLSFQKVRQLSNSGTSFLIKDRVSGNCARLYSNDVDGNIYTIWRKCQVGGFSILGLSRNGSLPFQPIFTKTVVSLSVKLFTEVKLHCLAHADPYPVYDWSRFQPISSGGSVVEFVLPEYDLRDVLVISNVTWADRGSYFCNAWNSEGSASMEFVLAVEPLQWFEEAPSDTRVIYGQSVLFDCVSRGIPDPNVTWRMSTTAWPGLTAVESLLDPRFAVMENGSLQISKVSYDDEGQIYCMSASPGFVRNVSAILDVYVTQEFVIQPLNASLLFGSNHVFVCKSDGMPQPVVSWEFQSRNMDRPVNVDVSMMADFEVLANGSLLVKDVDLEVQGEVVCVSTSPGLQARARATLNVYVTQSFVDVPKNQSALYGSYALFTCKSEGHPTPVVTWRAFVSAKSGFTDLVTNGKFEVFGNGSLLVRNVTYDDQGEYVCTSSSPGLQRNRSAYLRTYVTQEFVTVPESRTLVIGEQLLLHCQVSGFPTPQIMWKRKNASNANISPVNLQNPRVMLLSNNSLYFRTVEKSDEGTYFCFSFSPGLVRNVSAVVVVYIPPFVALSSLSQTEFAHHDVTVNCSTVGDPTPVLQWYKKSVSGLVLIANAHSQLILQKVRKENEGHYVCKATNAGGEDAVTFTLVVTETCILRGVKYGSVAPQKVLFSEGENVTVYCDPGFKISGEQHFKCLPTGDWSGDLPHCKDINECASGNDTDAARVDESSGDADSAPKGVLISTVPASAPNDDEPDLCDVNAQCVNTVGSFQCICDEGYVGNGFSCEWRPAEVTTLKPKIKTEEVIGTQPPTQVPAKTFPHMELLIYQYANDTVTEYELLTELVTFSGNDLLKLSFKQWRVSAVLQSVLALKALMRKAVAPNSALAVISTSKSRPALEYLQLMAAVISNLLDSKLASEWESIQSMTKSSCAQLMQMLEEYAHAKLPKSHDGEFDISRQIILQNIVMRLQAAKPLSSATSVRFQVVDDADRSGCTVDLPSEILDDGVLVGILYKSLHLLLPPPVVDGASMSSFFSKVFSMSVTRLTKSPPFVKPVQLTFKTNQDFVPRKMMCSFFDASLSPEGSWSSNGCHLSNLTSGSNVVCLCDHLTNFAVIMPQGTAFKILYLTFYLTAAIGITLCMALAFITCLSHICCPSYHRSERQTILCNITICILLLTIVFGGGVLVAYLKLVPDSFAKYFSYMLLGSLQLLVVSFFAWSFAEAIQLYLSTRTLIEKGSGRVKLFYLIGWGIPVVILGGTSLLVYFNVFRLQAYKSLFDVPLWMVAMAVGGPSVVYVLLTFVFYVIASVTLRTNHDLLSTSSRGHVRQVLRCSTVLVILHAIVAVFMVLFLFKNGHTIFHHVLAGLAAVEGIFLVVYHCVLERRISNGSLSRQSSANKKRASYSTKETVTYEVPNSPETEEHKFLIKRSSKRMSTDPTKASPQIPRLHPNEVSHGSLEWEGNGTDMYGSIKPNSIGSPKSDVGVSLLSQDSFDDHVANANLEEMEDRTPAELPRTFNNDSLRRKRQDHPESSPACTEEEKPRGHSRASSIVSIETHHQAAARQGIPVYWPKAPPLHHMSLERRKKEPVSERVPEEDPFAHSTPRTSIGIDADRMSNISSELTNILHELQAFNTDKPLANGSSDLGSKKSSTFKPDRTKPKYQMVAVHSGDGHRVRLVRSGRGKTGADPSDGLHAANAVDTMYSSL